MDRVDGERRPWQGTGGAGAAHNDPDAFSAAFTRFAPALYDFLARLSGRAEAADALLRQAASQAAMGAASAAQWPTMRAWLFARSLAVLPQDSSASGADPTPFSDPDPARLPPASPDSGLADMARVVWRAISALSIGQHALLHLHVRERMTTGEVASVLGFSEREATDRLARVVTAVEETSRALFLIRYGRSRDPRLNELLTDHNVTRLTPELRGFLEDYLRTSPSAQAMLAAVPTPLELYAAFRPLPVPEGLVAEAASGALPWLASGGAAFPAAAAATTAVIPPPDAPTTFVPETPPAYDFSATAPVNGTYPPGYAEVTAVNPAFSPNGYDPHAYGAGGYDPYSYGAQTGYTAPPPGSGPIEGMQGTQMLDIPVRQRMVGDQPPIYVPPRRPPPSSGPSPLAIIGGVFGALLLVIFALVIFLARGASQSNARVTATVLVTVSPTAVTSVVPDALLTSTALANNRLLTVTALAGTPTEIPTGTPAPQTVSTGVPDVPTVAIPTVAIPTLAMSTETPTTAAVMIVPLITQAPIDAPRATPVMTRPIPTMQPTAASSAQATSAGTVVSTTGATVITTAAPSTAATAAATAAMTAPTAKATTAATVAPTAAATAKATTAGMMTPTATATAKAAGVTVDNGFVSIGSGNTGTVTVTNKGAATTFMASSNQKFIMVSPASGSIGANGTAGITITVNRTGLEKGGSYGGAVTVTTGNGNVMILVNFTT